MYQLSWLDTSIVVIYPVVMIVIGLYAMTKNKNAEDYCVGGRRTGTFTLGCLWMSSWIGGATVIGSVDAAYTVGISALWYCGSMMLGCIFFGITSSGIIQRVGAKFACLTYPELIELRYGPASRLIATLTTFLAYIAYSAGQFLAQAKLLEVFLGWDLSLSVWVSAASMVVYTALGGFIAIAITGRAQAVIILVSLACVMAPIMGFVLLSTPVTAELPTTFYDIGSWGWGKCLGMTVTITLTFFTSMDSYTRCFAAKDAKTSRNGAYLAAGMVFIIAIATIFLGMSSRAIMPTLPAGASVMSTLILQYMPVGVKGVVLIGLLAAIMSTGAVSLLVATTNITHDIYKRFIAPQTSNSGMIILGVFTTVTVGVLAAWLALARQNIIDILYIAFTINSAGLFVPTIAAVTWNKGNAVAATWSMALSLVTVLSWYVGQVYWPDSTLLAIDPVWAGLLVSAVVFFLGASCVQVTQAERDKITLFQQATLK